MTFDIGDMFYKYDFWKAGNISEEKFLRHGMSSARSGM